MRQIVLDTETTGLNAATGDRVIEINPRISTVVYQEDLNLPWLGVKRALGEISDDELAAMRTRVRPGRTALRYFDQVEWDQR